jgi:teichuronic acid biosynthesis glycosyltransferase TuaG
VTGRVTPPAASIVVTTRATPTELLAISIDSLLTQTMADLEVVLVIDGELSADSEQLVTTTQSADQRLIVVRPGAVGRARALNLGLGTARAPLVGIQDADDASHPRRLVLQLELFDCLPELSVLGTGARITTSLTERADWDLPPDGLGVRPIGRAVLRSNPLIHSSALVRREAIEAVGGYDESRAAQFDYDLWLRLHQRGLMLANCDVPLVLHRRHARQFFEGLGPIRRAWSSCQLQASHLSEIPAPERIGYYGIAGGRLVYQVVRGLAWRRATRLRTQPGR